MQAVSAAVGQRDAVGDLVARHVVAVGARRRLGLELDAEAVVELGLVDLLDGDLPGRAAARAPEDAERGRIGLDAEGLTGSLGVADLDQRFFGEVRRPAAIARGRAVVRPLDAAQPADEEVVARAADVVTAQPHQDRARGDVPAGVDLPDGHHARRLHPPRLTIEAPVGGGSVGVRHQHGLVLDVLQAVPVERSEVAARLQGVEQGLVGGEIHRRPHVDLVQEERLPAPDAKRRADGVVDVDGQPDGRVHRRRLVRREWGERERRLLGAHILGRLHRASRHRERNRNQQQTGRTNLTCRHRSLRKWYWQFSRPIVRATIGPNSWAATQQVMLHMKQVLENEHQQSREIGSTKPGLSAIPTGGCKNS